MSQQTYTEHQIERAQYEQRKDLEKIDPETWKKLVKTAREIMPRSFKKLVRNMMDRDSLWWTKDRFHFNQGMWFRNQLRAVGYTESELGILNLDNIYVELIEQALAE